MGSFAGRIWCQRELASDADRQTQLAAYLSPNGPLPAICHRSEFRPGPGIDPTPGALLVQGSPEEQDSPTERADQLPGNEDGSVRVLMVGRLENLRQLRHRLEGAGHRLRSESPAELLAHLYEDHGKDFLNYITGSLAVAIWDEPRGRVLLGTDRFGKRSLIYAADEQVLQFAGSLAALRQIATEPFSLEPGAVDAYLTYGYVPHPQTMLAGVRRVAPGEVVIYQAGRLESHTYWSLDPDAATAPEDAVAELTARLATSVERQVQGASRVGVLLDGSQASWLLASICRELAGPITLFSLPAGEQAAGYDDRNCRLGELLQCEVHPATATEETFADLPARLAAGLDGPVARAELPAEFVLAEAASGEVDRLLSAAGADVLLSQLPRHQAVPLSAWLGRIPPGVPQLLNLTRRIVPQSARRDEAWRLALAAVRNKQSRAYLDWVSVFDETARGGLYTDEFIARLPAADPAMNLITALARHSKLDPLSRAALADLATALPGTLPSLCQYATPWLEASLAGLLVTMPSDIKHPRWPRPALLRRAMSRRHPHAPRPLPRPPGADFAWLAADDWRAAREVLLDETTLVRGIFRRDAFEALLATPDEHRSVRVWAIVMLEHWLRRYLDESSP